MTDGEKTPAVVTAAPKIAPEAIDLDDVAISKMFVDTL
jgi:hypothetical protein